MFSFSVSQTDGKARLGRLATPHGEVATPAFMPVGTAASVKGVTPDQLRAAGAQMVLANTYHMLLRPGPQTVANLGGLHKMMGWTGPILTDSGGYQVFSLAHLRKISDHAVVFKSHIDGSEIELTPEHAIEVQQQLGADIIMQLDECPPGGASKEHVAEAVRRSADWAGRCRNVWQSSSDTQALFAIQQGGVFNDLRAESAGRIVKLDLPGYAIGGLSVGEGHEAMVSVLEAADEQFPADKPRYLMGVGEPRDIIAAVTRGVDLFDCVMPTRNGRNAQAFTRQGRIRLRNSRWTDYAGPIDESCDCYTCRNFSRGTLRYLFMAKEMLGPTLVSVHNLRFFARFMAALRDAIAAGNLASASAGWLDAMYAAQDNGE